MAVTVYEKRRLHREQLQDHLSLLSLFFDYHGKSHYFRSLCELFSETFVNCVAQKMFKNVLLKGTKENIFAGRFL